MIPGTNSFFCALALLIAPAWAALPPAGPEPAPTEQSKPSPLDVAPDDLTDNEVDAISSAISAAVRTVINSSRDKISKQSSIRGRCVYRKGFCPGAVIELRDERGLVVDQQLLASSDGFFFSGLKPGRYLLRGTYPRYKVKTVEKPVFAGSDVVLEFGAP